ncbi:hypothetical protein [Marinobacterium jannaschii]|uniref:hypothetical protein n=1 Tax=Marinobacterium jannaschii TaxID=64970 RepID=UPI000AD16FE5|nr:hypothetical protein [Marinobacterium jannaschii]
MGSYQIYLRHPDEIPVSLQQAGQDRLPAAGSDGIGVICHCDNGYAPGEQVRMMIPLIDDAIDPLGRVDWCQPSQGGYELAIRFQDNDNAMRARMLEQLSHIYRYRQHVLQQQQRYLSLDEAALEWIERYAALFPADHV